MPRLFGLLSAVLFGPLVAAQPAPPSEYGPVEYGYSLPYDVQAEVDQYVDSLTPERRGEPFVILRGGWGRRDTMEVAVLIGPRNPLDSLRFSQPGRVLRAARYRYGVAFAGEMQWGLFQGPGFLQLCLSGERAAYFFRYYASGDALEIEHVGEQPVYWCLPP